MSLSKQLLSLISEVANHTLKKDVNGNREWDRMKLTMFVSFVWCIVIATLDYIFHGFRSEVWFTLIGLAFGSKLIDAQAKKIEK